MQNFKPLAIFWGGTAWFVWDLVGNPEDRFFDVAAHIILTLHTCDVEQILSISLEASAGGSILLNSPVLRRGVGTNNVLPACKHNATWLNFYSIYRFQDSFLSRKATTFNFYGFMLLIAFAELR